MHNYSHMRNKQIVINQCKFVLFFKFSRTQACKMTPFSWFREFAPPIKKYPLFRENGYERGMRFGREWGVGMGWVWLCGGRVEGVGVGGFVQWWLSNGWKLGDPKAQCWLSFGHANVRHSWNVSTFKCLCSNSSPMPHIARIRRHHGKIHMDVFIRVVDVVWLSAPSISHKLVRGFIVFWFVVILWVFGKLCDISSHIFLSCSAGSWKIVCFYCQIGTGLGLKLWIFHVFPVRLAYLFVEEATTEINLYDIIAGVALRY